MLQLDITEVGVAGGGRERTSCPFSALHLCHVFTAVESDVTLNLDML